MPKYSHLLSFLLTDNNKRAQLRILMGTYLIAPENEQFSNVYDQSKGILPITANSLKIKMQNPYSKNSGKIGGDRFEKVLKRR